MGLQIAVRHVGDIAVLDLQGRATIGLAGATQLDSSSISTVVRAFVSLRNRGGVLKLLSPRGNVKMVLEMLRLLNVIPNFDDEAAALISFESRKASSH
jgi:anti-anti-sigma regulatory factor